MSWEGVIGIAALIGSLASLGMLFVVRRELAELRASVRLQEKQDQRDSADRRDRLEATSRARFDPVIQKGTDGHYVLLIRNGGQGDARDVRVEIDDEPAGDWKYTYGGPEPGFTARAGRAPAQYRLEASAMRPDPCKVRIMWTDGTGSHEETFTVPG